MKIDNNIIFDTVNNGIIILDENLDILAWNRWLEIFTNIKEDTIVGQNICEYFSYINKSKLQRKIKTVLVTNSPTFFNIDTNKYLINIPVSNITNQAFTYMQQDITILPYNLERKQVCIYIYDNTQMCEINHQLEKVNAKLIDMSHRDPLTQIFNRRYYSTQSRKIQSFSQRNNLPLCVSIIDIDKFKNINDTYGHLVGDEVIIQVAKIIEAEVRTSDIVARFGGEEFIMLLQDCTIENSLIVAQKVRKNIEKSKVLLPDGTVVKFTASLGVAQFNQDMDNNNLENTLSRADKALYKSKEEGRNKVTASS